MSEHPLAGRPAPEDTLVDVDVLVAAYFDRQPDPDDPTARVAFGTSGHRGSSLKGSFTESHVLAIVQAICEHRAAAGITGPLFLGGDTHALSAPALRDAIEVLAANGVTTLVEHGLAPVPTPALSRAVLAHHRRTGIPADGILATPSHNPPEDGGLKYNPPHGGPADTTITGPIQDRANRILAAGLADVRRMPFDAAIRSGHIHEFDFRTPYVAELTEVLDLDAVRTAGVRMGVDPLGGASVHYWDAIAERHGLDLSVVNPRVDPTFGFMTLDHDGRIRMDCSSPFAMAGLIALRDRFDIAFGTDPDADRHGIVTPGAGLMNPNAFLAVAIDYLFARRPGWPADAHVGKTLVSSSLIDRVATGIGRTVSEVPVGFKWFVPGLADGSCGFGGEESAGASFLRRDGTAWTTDKDGILLCLLAAEITANTGEDPGRRYEALTARHGTPWYARIDAPANASQRRALAGLSPDRVTAAELAGEPIRARLTHAPGNGAPIGGLKVVAETGWFAARPSGTEDLYKIYAESFQDQAHLRRIQEEARGIVARALADEV
jgi:phosphoglucomutase